MSVILGRSSVSCADADPRCADRHIPRVVIVSWMRATEGGLWRSPSRGDGGLPDPGVWPAGSRSLTRPAPPAPRRRQHRCVAAHLLGPRSCRCQHPRSRGIGLAMTQYTTASATSRTTTSSGVRRDRILVHHYVSWLVSLVGLGRGGQTRAPDCPGSGRSPSGTLRPAPSAFV